MILDEGLFQVNKAYTPEELKEIIELGKKIGITTTSEMKRFKAEPENQGKDLLTALKEYIAKLGDDFHVENESLAESSGEEYIKSSDENFEKDKEAEREAEVELAKNGVQTEALEEAAPTKHSFIVTSDDGDKIEILATSKEKAIEQMRKFFEGPIKMEDEKHEVVWKVYESVEPLAEDLENIDTASLVPEAETSIPETPTAEDAGIAFLLNNLLKSEIDAIDLYNSGVATAEAEGKHDIAEVLTEIANDEQKHMGSLSTLLGLVNPQTASVPEGMEEAEEILDKAESSVEDTAKIAD